jgi:hypothetical protein
MAGAGAPPAVISADTPRNEARGLREATERALFEVDDLLRAEGLYAA